MEIPVLKGTIGRRILVNYRAEPEVIQSKLPAPFHPKLHQGEAIVGVCLIRLENIRPASCSLPIGFSSENAAHRIAVVWENEEGETQEGVFIPRRDTGSPLNHITGDRLFPGQHHLANFRVCTTKTHIDFQMHSRDGKVEIRVKGEINSELPKSSTFSPLAETSSFFEADCLGYLVRCNTNRLDGLLLKTKTWEVDALDVSEAFSSYYSDKEQFPKAMVRTELRSDSSVATQGWIGRMSFHPTRLQV